jgi:phosphoenolpyruvate-protein phosphotransferase (PTS system enzyme I)
MAQESRKKIVRKFQGLSINSGRVAGKVCLFSAERHKAVPQYSLKNEDAITHELDRFQEVLDQCSEELNHIANEVTDSIGKAESEIFLTQKHIMNDPKVLAEVRREVSEQHKNAEWAISKVLGRFEEQFAKLDNQYLRERSSDIGEIRRRLLSRLSNKRSGFVCQGQAHCVHGENRIIVADELTSEMVTAMKFEKVLGFVTEHGGITSHAAIIARSLGIPAVSGITGIMEVVQCGDEMIVDGDKGEAYLNPDPGLIETVIPLEQVQDENVCLLVTPPGMEVMANVSTVEDARRAHLAGADGIGLVRTEMLFIKADRLLSLDEQYAFYAEVSKEMDGKTVTFRLLDAGGDKPIPSLRIKQEANPFLGWRGSRFLLGNPDIFEEQVKAIGRVSAFGKIRILFPMVVDTVQLKALVEGTRKALGKIDHEPGNIQIGVMFEIPSAFLDAREILKLVDFGSIGSNDLIQYLFAIDRGNEMVSQDYNPEHPTLWNLLKLIAGIANDLGKPLSICGEMAAREGIPTRLLEIGITSLSVAPRLIPRVRNEMARFVDSGRKPALSHQNI